MPKRFYCANGSAFEVLSAQFEQLFVLTQLFARLFENSHSFFCSSRYFPSSLPEGEEEVFQVVLAVSLEQHQGFLTLCMPAVMIEAVAEAILSGNAPLPAAGEQGQEEQQEQQEQEPAGLADEVRVSVHLPATQIAGQDLEGLQLGEIITTDIASDVPLEMQLDGRLLYQSEAGIVDGRLAARITGLLDSGESMDPAAENPLEELAD